MYDVSFEVHNETRKQLDVTYEAKRDSIVTDKILPGDQLQIHMAFGIGMTSRMYLRDIEILPFDLLEIEKDSLEYQQEVFNVERWEKEEFSDVQPSRMYLVVREEDFE